jgi:hypothetical protein
MLPPGGQPPYGRCGRQYAASARGQYLGQQSKSPCRRRCLPVQGFRIDDKTVSQTARAAIFCQSGKNFDCHPQPELPASPGKKSASYVQNGKDREYIVFSEILDSAGFRMM